jgi:hypothetical protein
VKILATKALGSAEVTLVAIGNQPLLPLQLLLPLPLLPLLPQISVLCTKSI